MPSPFLTILAQESAPGAPQQPDPAPAEREFSLLEPPTAIFRHEFPYAPIVAIPVFIGALVVLSFIVERISAWLVKRLTARTQTTVDDAFVGGLPAIVRIALVFIGAIVVVQALVHDAARLEVALNVVQAAGVVAIGLALTGLALRVVDAWTNDKPHMRPVGPGIKLTLKVLVIPLLLVLVLQVFGVDIAAFLTVLGVGSLAVALALQDVLRNIFSGIQLVIDQPVRAGDFVSVDDGRVRGVVLEVGLRSTRLRTLENSVIILPNATLANATITNTDVLDPLYAHVLKIGVAYGSDTRRVQEVLKDEVESTVRENPAFAAEPVVVQFIEMGDFALTFRVIVKLRQFSGYVDPVSELLHRIYARLGREGIEIPFPTRTLHVKHAAEPQRADATRAAS